MDPLCTRTRRVLAATCLLALVAVPQALAQGNVTTQVNSGEVVASETSEIIGDPINVAARLQEAARDGEVVIGESTRRLVGAIVTLEPLGNLALKGRAETVGASLREPFAPPQVPRAPYTTLPPASSSASRLLHGTWSLGHGPWALVLGLGPGEVSGRASDTSDAYTSRVAARIGRIKGRVGRPARPPRRRAGTARPTSDSAFGVRRSALTVAYVFTRLPSQRTIVPWRWLMLTM